MTYASVLKSAAMKALERFGSVNNKTNNISPVFIASPSELQINYIQENKYVEEASDFLLNQKVTLGVDIETYPKENFVGDKNAGLDPYRSEIRLVQFSCGENLAFVFDLLKIDGIHQLGKAIWSKPMIAHNAVFELKHLLHKGISPSQIGCTMLLANALYGGKLLTGRIHPSFWIGGTRTGRLSCSKPNMQNAPRGVFFRKLFNAEEGHALVVADFSQIELRVAALLAQDKKMLAAYQEGRDLHRETAAAILKISPEKVSAEQRQMAKAVNFGLLYGQGSRGLAFYAKRSYGVDMTEEEAVAATLGEMQPQDAVEGLLITQLTGLHNQMMHYMKLSLDEEYRAEEYLSRFLKLNRQFLATLKGLLRYRNRGQQNVIVQNVNIGPEGRAIVGCIQNSS